MNEAIRIFRDLDKTYDLHVMWSVHNKCNYSCSYCPDELHNGSMGWLKLDEIKLFVEHLLSHYKHKLNFKNFLFSFTGGEPTLWKDFKPFVQFLMNKGIRVGLTTNGSVAPHFWDNIVECFDYICLSFHPESASKEKFLKVYKRLHDDPHSVTPSIRVMMPSEDESWDKSVSLIEDIKKFDNYSYECIHILKNYGKGSEKIEYESKEKREFLEKNAFVAHFTNNEILPVPLLGFDHYKVEYKNGKIEQLHENKLINNNQVNFKDWKCYIGVEQLFVHFTGVVKTSGCAMGEELGNLRWPNLITYPSEPVICKLKGCYCPTDVRISKSIQGLELPQPV